MPVYPEKITRRLLSPSNIGEPNESDAVGTGVDFTCGVSIKFYLTIYNRVVAASGFKSNGCGFVIAAADFLSGWVNGRHLTDLHSLENLSEILAAEFGEIPENRRHCVDLCQAALENAFAEYRISQLEEWNGEKALICTCFGVSEERIERLIDIGNLETVEAVGDECGAGTGCGSCQMLIRELLDAAGAG